MAAQNLQGSIRARVIIGNDRIYVAADVIECVLEDKFFIADAGYSDQKVSMAHEASIAANDFLTVAELPTARTQHDHPPGCDSTLTRHVDAEVKSARAKVFPG
jgi:hypothetical protein